MAEKKDETKPKSRTDRVVEDGGKHPRTLTLPVRLEAVELDLRARQLAGVTGEAGDLELKLSRSEHVWKTEKKKLEGEIADKRKEAGDLARVVRTGQEDREVVVERVFDYGEKLVETIRTDTGEIVNRRPMTHDETQRPLPFKPREAERQAQAAGAGKKAGKGKATTAPPAGDEGGSK